MHGNLPRIAASKRFASLFTHFTGNQFDLYEQQSDRHVSHQRNTGPRTAQTTS